MSEYRIGIGYDIHKLCNGRDLIIGGLKINYEKGLLGHSDADVLVHAIIDALLGASAMSDIGTLFPDTDEKYKNADSMELLRQVCALITSKGYKICNIDSIIIVQKPKMLPYISAIRENIAAAAGIEKESISVKSKTKEGLDSTGEGIAIEANAVTILMK